MAEKFIKQTLTASFTRGTPPIALEKVEGTSCFTLKVDVFTASYVGMFYVFTTSGTLEREGTRSVTLKETLTFTGQSSASLSKPGVTKINSVSMQGYAKDLYGIQLSGITFVFDGDSNSLRVSSGASIFAVVEIEYVASSVRYAFNWPSDGSVTESIITVVSESGEKQSITVDLNDCFSDQDNNEDTLEQYRMSMNCFATVGNISSDVPFSVEVFPTNIYNTSFGFTAYALVHMYPFPDVINPQFMVSVGTSPALIDDYVVERSVLNHKLSEFIQFSNDSITNLSSLPSNFSSFSITQISPFYNGKGQAENFISFRRPGDSVRNSDGSSFFLGPTQVAVVNAFDRLVPVSGTAAVQYEVTLKTIAFKLSLPKAAQLFENWDVKIFCSALIDTGIGSVDQRTALLSGECQIPNPYNNQVVSNQAENDLMTKYFPS